MDREARDQAVRRLRAAVLAGTVLGLVASTAVVGAIDVSVETATVMVTNEDETSQIVRIVSERDGHRVERSRELDPGEAVRPVQLLEDGTYVVKVYVDGQLCAHMTAEVVGSNVVSTGTVTTTGNSLTAACTTTITEADGPTVRAG